MQSLYQKMEQYGLFYPKYAIVLPKNLADFLVWLSEENKLFITGLFMAFYVSEMNVTGRLWWTWVMRRIGEEVNRRIAQQSQPWVC